MKVVVDTNVLVSGLLNPHGAPGEIVRLLAKGTLTIYYDSRVLREYHDVFRRSKFKFDKTAVADFLLFLQAEGESSVGLPLKKPLPDPHDEKFLEVALAGLAECLITGNARHLPVSLTKLVKILSPAQFITLIR